MYYCRVILKNVAKATGFHLRWSVLSICNLQLHRKREASKYSFLWVLRNFLRTVLSWKNSCELVLKGQFYEKWWTDILIIIKRYREVDSSFKKDIARESVYLRTIDRKLTLNLIVFFNSFTDISFLKYVTKIFSVSYYCQVKILECFKVKLWVVVFVYILSSKGANQL